MLVFDVRIERTGPVQNAKAVKTLAANSAVAESFRYAIEDVG
jgi:hypothetical protein